MCLLIDHPYKSEPIGISRVYFMCLLIDHPYKSEPIGISRVYLMNREACPSYYEANRERQMH
jgi:hypothetical protein